MRKWGALAAILGGLWVLALVSVLAVVHVRLMPRPSAMPVTQKVGPPQPVHRPVPTLPTGQPLSRFTMPDSTDVARDMGIVVYPSAAPGGGAWSGGGPWIDGAVNFVTEASYGEVVRYYQSQLREMSPTIRSAQPLVSVNRFTLFRPYYQTLFFWQNRESCCAVRVDRDSDLVLPLAGPPDDRTFITAAHAFLPLKMLGPSASRSRGQRGVAPDRLGLAVYPGATVDYSGWCPGENGEVAVARFETMASGRRVADFYRSQVGKAQILSDGRPYGNGRMTIRCLYWNATGDRHAVAIIDAGPQLGTIVWLQHSQHHLQGAHAS